MKRCADCGQWKLVTAFPRNRRMRDGHHCYCKPCHNARGRGNKQKLYGGSRHYHLLRRYGIGMGDVAQLVQKQGGVCPICGRPGPEHVDHDHKTKIVRGILCFNCNGGLGQFRDDVGALRNAIEYLEDGVDSLVAASEVASGARERVMALRSSTA